MKTLIKAVLVVGTLTPMVAFADGAATGSAAPAKTAPAKTTTPAKAAPTTTPAKAAPTTPAKDPKAPATPATK